MINVSNFLGIYIFQTKTILQHIKHKENDKNFLSNCQNWLIVQLRQYETEKNWCNYSKTKHFLHKLCILFGFKTLPKASLTYNLWKI